MAVFAQFCSVQVAGLYAMKTETLVDPVARALHGGMGELPLFDPLLRLALAERRLVSVRLDAAASERHGSELLAVVPIVDSRGRLHGVLAVRDMHFMAFQQKNLDTLALLASYVGDLIARSGGLGDAPAERFVAELDTALRFVRSHDVRSSLVRLRLDPRARGEEIAALLVDGLRSLDTAWRPPVAVGGATTLAYSCRWSGSTGRTPGSSARPRPSRSVSGRVSTRRWSRRASCRWSGRTIDGSVSSSSVRTSRPGRVRRCRVSVTTGTSIMSPEPTPALAPGFARAATVPALALALGAEAWLLGALVVGDAGPAAGPSLGTPAEPTSWIVAHLVASAVGAAASAALVARLSPDRPRRVFALCLLFGASMPFAGLLGAAVGLTLGFRHAIGRRRENVYWRFTDAPTLPFTTPAGREVGTLDERGLAERLLHGDDPDALYRQVLAAGRIRSSLSIDALSGAVRHPDERIRLTAYQTLDRKVSALNAEIQRLERLVANREGQERSDAWLQVASNYWELLTLEQGEPVAREQLLGKAASAALRAVVARPDDRNAHFTLGRIALRRGEPAKARVAFERAAALGMPEETTLPYLAEAAFDAREFASVKPNLDRVGRAFLAYPPLREVAAQWR